MQKDLTRQEAIKWCKDKKCDFKTPILPPPSGWFWAEGKDGLCLEPIFTITDQGDEITSKEVFNN